MNEAKKQQQEFELNANNLDEDFPEWSRFV